MTDAVRTARVGSGVRAQARTPGRSGRDRIDASAYLRECIETGAQDGAGRERELSNPASALRAARGAAA